MNGDVNVTKALRLVEEIEAAADQITEDNFHENPDAMDFAESIKTRAGNIGEWIEQNDHVTPKQLVALQNMLRGAQKWLD